ncbi:MAG: hypothetical protein EA398_02505 [Deltaproteobacteria bacterium]|nr:MAG: hypothetical protein EA398_02505 [Deltaproteobacteria bacterium]
MCNASLGRTIPARTQRAPVPESPIGIVKSPLTRLRPDAVFATLLVGLVALLVLPLPTVLLDLLLAANLAWAFVLLLVALHIPHPLRLSTFPSILLIATLFRLGLNVSSTRLILGQGDAGKVISAFGDFVVRGNYIVGAVVFLILTLIQFLVIAKGAERVAEVAARFTLDAMPGRQMAIDADLRAGAFSLEEARERRQQLQAESHLFGSLDGAMKFVKGDAIAGLLITVINVLGGLLVGVAQQGMSAGDAATTYTLLTVGDGLVSQIPALLVTLSAGLLVTRVAAREDAHSDLGADILRQLTAESRVFPIAAVLLAGLALVPGLPVLPFAVLSAGSLLLWRNLLHKQRERERETIEEGDAPGTEPEALFEPVAAVTIEVGADLAPLLHHESQPGLLQQEISLVRQGLFRKLGIRLPGVRVRFSDDPASANTIRLQVWEIDEPLFRVPITETLLLESADAARSLGIDALPASHPMGGGVACVVSPDDAERAEAAGLLVCSTARRIMLEVAARLEEHASAFIGLAEVQGALDALEATHGALVESVIPRPVSLARLTGVLRRLVEDGIAVRDLRGVLEALAAEAREDHDLVQLTEIARVGLGKRIARDAAPDGHLTAWIVDAPLEEVVRSAVRRDGDRPVLALSPSETEQVLAAFRAAVPSDGAPVILASQDVRRVLQQLVRVAQPGARVLGLREIAGHASITAVGTIGAPEAIPPRLEPRVA